MTKGIHYASAGPKGPAGAARYLIKPAAALLPQLPDRPRALDIGCGNGFWAGWLVARGFSVVGIDPSPSGIALARESCPQARFEQMPVERGLCERLVEPPFDLIVSFEVIEHLYSPAEWADACREALRPGGILLCSTPYHGYLKNLAISMAGRWEKHMSHLYEGGHIKMWSKNTLQSLLDRAGFKNTRFCGAGRLPYLWKSIIVSARKPM